jgi:hypothetical protein
MALEFGWYLNRFESIAILGQRSGCKCRMARANLVSGILSNVTIGRW